eukprot:763601-Hanusia_phi.AAC.5
MEIWAEVAVGVGWQRRAGAGGAEDGDKNGKQDERERTSKEAADPGRMDAGRGLGNSSRACDGSVGASTRTLPGDDGKGFMVTAKIRDETLGIAMLDTSEKQVGQGEDAIECNGLRFHRVSFGGENEIKEVDIESAPLLPEQGHTTYLNSAAQPVSYKCLGRWSLTSCMQTVCLVLAITFLWSHATKLKNPIVLIPSNSCLPRNSNHEVRILSLNVCLLPGGMTFSGKWLFDGNDRKEDRSEKLMALVRNYDIVLLNELWGCWWSSYHTRFTRQAVEAGYHVVTTPVGFFFDTGNVIISKYPIQNASEVIFRSTAGWQKMVPNGALHAACKLPSGNLLHLFTTHFQCDTAPPTELIKPSGPNGPSDLEAGENLDNGIGISVVKMLEERSGMSCGTVREQQLEELKSFVDKTVTQDGLWLVGGDLNIVGGSEEYAHIVRIFGIDSVGAPDFEPTYNTHSFLTPPGWRGVEFNVCLDHILTNLAVQQFCVLPDDVSDHKALAVVVQDQSCFETNGVDIVDLHGAALRS